MRAISSLNAASPNAQVAIDKQARQPSKEIKAGIEGDPDRPASNSAVKQDFSNGAIYVKIPGIIDVGDLPDGVAGAQADTKQFSADGDVLDLSHQGQERIS